MVYSQTSSDGDRGEERFLTAPAEVVDTIRAALAALANDPESVERWFDPAAEIDLAGLAPGLAPIAGAARRREFWKALGRRLPSSHLELDRAWMLDATTCVFKAQLRGDGGATAAFAVACTCDPSWGVQRLRLFPTVRDAAAAASSAGTTEPAAPELSGDSR